MLLPELHRTEDVVQHAQSLINLLDVEIAEFRKVAARTDRFLASQIRRDYLRTNLVRLVREG